MSCHRTRPASPTVSVLPGFMATKRLVPNCENSSSDVASRAFSERRQHASPPPRRSRCRASRARNACGWPRIAPVAEPQQVAGLEITAIGPPSFPRHRSNTSVLRSASAATGSSRAARCAGRTPKPMPVPAARAPSTAYAIAHSGRRSPAPRGRAHWRSRTIARCRGPAPAAPPDHAQSIAASSREDDQDLATGRADRLQQADLVRAVPRPRRASRS